jgi:hypothetical protein
MFFILLATYRLVADTLPRVGLSNDVPFLVAKTLFRIGLSK